MFHSNGCRTNQTASRLLPVLSSAVGSARYANSTLLGISDKNISRLKRLQRTFARVVTCQRGCISIAKTLQELHWLPIKWRINYKVATLTYKLMESGEPTYLTSCIMSKIFRLFYYYIASIIVMFLLFYYYIASIIVMFLLFYYYIASIIIRFLQFYYHIASIIVMFLLFYYYIASIIVRFLLFYYYIASIIVMFLLFYYYIASIIVMFLLFHYYIASIIVMFLLFHYYNYSLNNC